MPPKRRRVWAGYAVFAVLVIVGLFVVDGAAAGVVLFAGLLVFIGACIYALRGEDVETRRRSDRAGLTGWFGGWF